LRPSLGFYADKAFLLSTFMTPVYEAKAVSFEAPITAMNPGWKRKSITLK